MGILEVEHLFFVMKTLTPSQQFDNEVAAVFSRWIDESDLNIQKHTGKAKSKK